MSEKETKQEAKYVQLLERRAVITIPANTVTLDLQVRVFDGAGIQTVYKSLNMDGVREAFNKGDDYIDDEDVFKITDKGLASLEEKNDGCRVMMDERGVPILDMTPTNTEAEGDPNAQAPKTKPVRKQKKA